MNGVKGATENADVHYLAYFPNLGRNIATGGETNSSSAICLAYHLKRSSYQFQERLLLER